MKCRVEIGGVVFPAQVISSPTEENEVHILVSDPGDLDLSFRKMRVTQLGRGPRQCSNCGHEISSLERVVVELGHFDYSGVVASVISNEDNILELRCHYEKVEYAN